MQAKSGHLCETAAKEGLVQVCELGGAGSQVITRVG